VPLDGKMKRSRKYTGPVFRAARPILYAARDAYLATQAAELDTEWADEDRALADPKFRRELSSALVASGYKPLDDTPLAEQRSATRSYVKQKGGGSKRARSSTPKCPRSPTSCST
jgi:hypothetical protein